MAKCSFVLDDAATHRYLPETIGNKASPLLHPPRAEVAWRKRPDRSAQVCRSAYTSRAHTSFLDGPVQANIGDTINRTRPKNRSYRNVHGLLSC